MMAYPKKISELESPELYTIKQFNDILGWKAISKHLGTGCWANETHYDLAASVFDDKPMPHWATQVVWFSF